MELAFHYGDIHELLLYEWVIYPQQTFFWCFLWVFLVNFWSLAHKSLVSPKTNHLHWPPRPLAPWESSHHYCGATVDLWNRTHPGNRHFQDASRDILNIMRDHGRYSNGIYWYIQYTSIYCSFWSIVTPTNMWVMTYQMKQAEATWCRKFQGCQLNSRWIWVLSACTRNGISQKFNMKPIWNPYSSIFNMYPERSYLRICRRHSIRAGACIGPKLLSRSFCADWKARRSACRPEPFLFGASGALRISEIFSGQRRFDETASKNHRFIKAQDAWELLQHGYIVHVIKLFMDIRDDWPRLLLLPILIQSQIMEAYYTENSISKTCTFDDFDSVRNKTTSISLPSQTWDASSRTNKSPHRPILLGTMHQVRWEEKGKRSWHSLCDDLPKETAVASSNST